MPRIRSKREKSPGLTLRARCPDMSMPWRAAIAIERGSGASPRFQPPVAAESSTISSSTMSRPRSASTARNTPSARGERQMLPRQTKSMEFIGFTLIRYAPFVHLEAQNAKDFWATCIMVRVDMWDSTGNHHEERETQQGRHRRRTGRTAWLVAGSRWRLHQAQLCLQEFFRSLRLHDPRRAGRREDGPSSRLVERLQDCRRDAQHP